METRNKLLDGKTLVLIRAINATWIGRRVLGEVLVIDIIDIQPYSAIHHLFLSVPLEADLGVDRVIGLRGHRLRLSVDTRSGKERNGRDLIALNAQERH